MEMVSTKPTELEVAAVLATLVSLAKGRKSVTLDKAASHRLGFQNSVSIAFGSR